MGFDTRTMSLAHSEAKLLPQLQFHFLKSSFTSYSPSAAFLTFRLIWGFWKWSPVIPHNPKHGFWHQNHVSSMLRSWVTPRVGISLLEVPLDLLQPLNPVLVFQVDPRLLKMIPNESPYPRSMLETWFWCQNQRFVVWLIIWENFQKPQIDLKVKNWDEKL